MLQECKDEEAAEWWTKVKDSNCSQLRVLCETERGSKKRLTLIRYRVEAEFLNPGVSGDRHDLTLGPIAYHTMESAYVCKDKGA